MYELLQFSHLWHRRLHMLGTVQAHYRESECALYRLTQA